MTSRSPEPLRIRDREPAKRRRPWLLGRIVMRLVVGVALSAITLMVLLVGLGFLGEASTLSVIRAESETTRFSVASPQQASFQVRGYRLFGDGDFDNQCAETGLGPNWAVEPQLGAEVTYTAVTGLGPESRVLIEIRGFDDGRESAILRGPSGVVSIKDDIAMRSDPDCATPAAFRLPLWGPGEIGGEPTFRADGPSPTLISGSLEMYGRAAPLDYDASGWTNALFGAVGAGVAVDDQSLYASLSSAFQIPPGSRVSTLPGTASDSLKALRGFAILDGRHLKVAASTEAPEVFFFPPGAGAQPDRLKMSLLSQIGNDPNIQRIIQIIIWFVVVLPIALELIKPLFIRADEED